MVAMMVILGLGANAGLGARTSVVVEEMVHQVLTEKEVHGGVDGKAAEVLRRGRVIGGVESIRKV